LSLPQEREWKGESGKKKLLSKLFSAFQLRNLVLGITVKEVGSPEGRSARNQRNIYFFGSMYSSLGSLFTNLF
jgi:hypothetical protein